ncbi:MAG: CHAT domain-containing protein [Deltaproteobacteria bacterium]|nr:CHAT domain-containing protein [Candidatus Zymogenaceae bacterium]
MKKTIIPFAVIAVSFLLLTTAAAGTREQADAYAKKGFELYGTGTFKAAFEAYEKALEIYREIGLRRGEGITLSDLGRTCEKMDRLNDALLYHTEAADVFRQIEGWTDLGDTLHMIGLIHFKMGQYDEALSFLGEALALKKETGNTRGESVVRIDMAETYLRMGDRGKALSCIQDIVTMAEASADRHFKARLSYDAALLYHRMDLPDSTIIQAEKAIGYYRETGDAPGTVTAMILLGDGYLKVPRYEKAIDVYREAEKTAVTDQEKVKCLDRLGTAFITAGDVKSGITYKNQVLDYYRKTGDRLNEAMVLFSLAACTLGDEDEAIRHLTDALDIFHEINNPVGEGFSRAALALVYFSKKDFKQAKRYSAQVLFIVEKAKLQEIIDPLYLGMLYVGKGQYKEAIAFFERSLARNRETGNYLEIGYAAGYLGFAHKALGESENAVEYYKTAIDVAEKIRADINAESLRSAFFGGASFAYDEIVELLVGLGRTQEAFEYMERGRSRSLLDLLGTRTLIVREKDAQGLVAGEERLRNEIKRLGHKGNVFSDLTTLVSTGEKTTREIKEAQDNYVALTEEIQKRYPELGSLVSVKPLTSGEVQSLLIPGVRVIEYYLTEEMVYIFSLSKDDLAVFTVKMNRDELGKKITEFRQAIVNSLVKKDTDDFLIKSQALYDILITPALTSAGEKTLIIIPHRTLHYLPFSALYNGKEYLIDTHTLIVDPSASSLGFVTKKKKKPTGRIIAFGNPTTAYNPLPFAEREVETIGEIMGNVDAYFQDRAKETTGKDRFKEYAVIHLACHGKFREDDPLLSSLYLASDKSNDGMLSVWELFGLDLGRSSLVVLSACETGLSKVLNGDELIGLSRGFIYAGTPSLLVTLWEVADDSTGALMADFYRNLKQGVTKPEALRRAQLWLKTQKGFESPFYWAAFEMVGHWE